MNRRGHRDALIRNYHGEGYTAKEIRLMLLSEHELNISLSHLKRQFRQLGLRRHMQMADIAAVVDKIKVELSGSGQCLGYRAMWHRLRVTHKLNVNRETVRLCLSLMDPDGVETRRRHRLRRRLYVSQGPLYCIHLDGYDKLKPFGFAVHGAICGYSRKILWLRVGRSNNNPRVVASYYLDFLNEINGVPRKVRFDNGTENGVIGDLQKSLRWDHGDRAAGANSVQAGSSTSNQRIEQWWCTMKKGGIQYWIDNFKDMEDDNLWSKTDELHRECLRFCFMGIIQDELDQVKREWNSHRMQTSRSSSCPAGKPNILYSSPHNYGDDLFADKVKTSYPGYWFTLCSRSVGYPLSGRTFKFDIPAGIVQDLEEFVEREDVSRTTPMYKQVFNNIMTLEGLQMPGNEDQALHLYGVILGYLQ